MGCDPACFRSALGDFIINGHLYYQCIFNLRKRHSQKESVTGVRITVIVIGIISLMLAALGQGDIMSLLTGAYSIYTPGVIFPLMIAIFVFNKRKINTGIWIGAVVSGGMFGIVGTYYGSALTNIGVSASFMQYLTLIGMGLSLVLALISVRAKEAA